MTNGDAIRRLSDEQLVADYLSSTRCTDCELRGRCMEHCRTHGANERHFACHKIWLEWLKEQCSE